MGWRINGCVGARADLSSDSVIFKNKIVKVEICFGFGLVAAAVVVEKLVAELGYFVAIVVLVVSSAATACIYSHHTYPLQLSPIKTPRSSSECILVVCFS